MALIRFSVVSSFAAKHKNTWFKARKKVPLSFGLMGEKPNRNMAQLVAHLLWEQGAAGSSPAIPTPAEDCVGSLAQLVQSTSFTPRGSLVRVQ